MFSPGRLVRCIVSFCYVGIGGARVDSPVARFIPTSDACHEPNLLQSFPRRPPRGARVVLPRCHELRHESSTLYTLRRNPELDYTLCFNLIVVYVFTLCRKNIIRSRGDIVKTCCPASAATCVDGLRRIEDLIEFTSFYRSRAFSDRSIQLSLATKRNGVLRVKDSPWCVV